MADNGNKLKGALAAYLNQTAKPRDTMPDDRNPGEVRAALDRATAAVQASAAQPIAPSTGPEPKNPACGCAYCQGNTLAVPTNHKRRNGARAPSAPAVIFSPAPNVSTGIEIRYTVQGLGMRAITDPAGRKVGPPVFNETIEIQGWTMPAPDSVQ